MKKIPSFYAWFTSILMVLSAVSFAEAAYNNVTLSGDEDAGFYMLLELCEICDLLGLDSLNRHAADSGEHLVDDSLVNGGASFFCCMQSAVRARLVDNVYRLIPGITDMFYTVLDLPAEGTYIYKVKSVFADGTESPWSNVEEVTLFENGHGFELGDVNHDGSTDIADVTCLIDYLLGGVTEACEICGDMNGDEEVNIADVTALIDYLLAGN